MSPVDQVEHLYLNLVAHYGDGEQRELRAAAKLLIVALSKFREHGGSQWDQTVCEYLAIARDRPDKLARILEGHGSVKAM